MKHAITVLCLTLFAAIAGGVTVEVETAGWTGSGCTNGWRFANLGADGTTGTGSIIESPRFDQQAIVELTVMLQCSSVTPASRMSYVLLRNGKAVSTQKPFSTVAFADRPERQSIAVRPELRANAVRIFCADGWSVASVCILTRASPSPGFALLIS